MTCFRNFTGPIWAIFGGNLLLLSCMLFYLVWWIVSYRPNSSGGPAGVFSITAALITGVAAIILMSGGITSLSEDSKGFPVKFILLGAAALFFVMLLVTSTAFHRTVTSELMIVHLWAALELSVLAVLYGTGHLGLGRAVILAVLVGIAFIISLICYVLYFRLSGTASYWDGMMPLVMAAFVISVLLGMMAVS
jgi:hypothetical protein